MSYDVGDVEQIMIDVLKADPWLSDKANVKIIDHYGGEFDTKEDAKKSLPGLPGLFVTYGLDELKPSTPGRTYMQGNKYNVVVAASDLRGNYEAKAQAIVITGKVHNLLHLNTLDLSGVVHGLVRERRYPSIVNKFLAVYEMTFNIDWVD